MSNQNEPLVAIFEVPVMDAAQYDQVMKDLETVGESNPNGRLYHVASPKSGGWYVVDVWESEEKMGRFAQTLMPILEQNGVTPPQPRILPAHNIIAG